MKLIVGLGNPGTKYEQTRHNAGFLALDYFLKHHETIQCSSKFDAQICELHLDNQKVFIVKPQNYMNLSGEVLKDISSFYKVSPSTDILVIHDEVDLPIGSMRAAYGNSAAGHNGVQNIIDELGTKDFARIRVGVESREENSQIPTDEFVLQKFSDSELIILEDKIFPEINKLIEAFIQK